jgi:hypothetical protein
MHSQCTELERFCAEAEEALKQADIEGKKLIEEELMSEKPRLDQLRKQLEKARSDAEDLHEAVLGQETRWYCSELLKFLCGKKLYAINPFKLANALAGLPVMGWRESYSRCSKMQIRPRWTWLATPRCDWIGWNGIARSASLAC